MKKLILSLVLLFTVLGSWGFAQEPGLIKVEEVDGAPSGWVYKLIFPNASVSITGSVATLTLSGTGDVTGPTSTTENNIPQWDSTTKKLKDGKAIGTSSGTIAAGDHTHTANMVKPSSPTDGKVICWDGTTGLTKDCTEINVSTMNLPSSDAAPGTTAGQIRHDTSVTGFTRGAACFYDGTAVRCFLDDQAGAWNLVTTGTIQGGIKISSDADGMSAAEMTAVGLYGTLFIATGAGTWILPTAVQGMSACLMDSGTAHDLILDVTGSDTITLKGTEGSAGNGITNASGSTTGDFVCVVAIAANKWSTMGMAGTWAAQ